jgi:hypothetical protein
LFSMINAYQDKQRDIGDLPVAQHSTAEGVSVMKWFTRSKREVRTSRKPTGRERRAAERTAQAEARLRETEEKIHEIADEARSDLHGST